MIAMFQAGEFSLPLDRTYVMGILNVTPDSFSDGGKYLDPAQAVAHALEMKAQGADILDIGATWTQVGIFNYQSTAGGLFLPIGAYDNVADFTDEQYWDQISQQSCVYNGQLYFAVPYNASVGNYL